MNLVLNNMQETLMKSAYLATQKLLELKNAQVCGITNQTENLPEAEGSTRFPQFKK